MHLIQIIAQQTGVAVHTLLLTEALHQLNTDLQQSRERLVTAREEERRSLRRDLHDGVGPTLSSLSQRIDTAIDLLGRDPHASIALLDDVKGQVKATVAEIRRLVYALRPPVLDEFGLVSAIREHVAPYSGPNGYRVEIYAPETLPALPAAVEVAAYRILLEAFTNVIQHAHAAACSIDIQWTQRALLLEVMDDGVGVPAGARSGIGLASMRERAAELGGEFSIESRPSGGTRLRARLPIPES
jgi:signal transduction histidine kinase